MRSNTEASFTDLVCYLILFEKTFVGFLNQKHSEEYGLSPAIRELSVQNFDIFLRAMKKML